MVSGTGSILLQLETLEVVACNFGPGGNQRSARHYISARTNISSTHHCSL